MTVRKSRTAITVSKTAMAKNRRYRVLPDYYYKDPENYRAFWMTLIQFARSSRTLPEDLTRCMSKLYHKGNLHCLFVPHWHHITNEKDDGRTLRNLLQCDGLGRPKRQNRNIDLLRYIDICLQSQSESYLKYVENWCYQQEQCIGEEDEF